MKTFIYAAAAVFIGIVAARSDVIYDSTANYNGNAFSMVNGQEIGNEITVSPGSYWSLTNFSIEYYSPDVTLSTSVGIDVRFYLNNGPATNGFATPGTLFYDSGWFYNTALGGMPGNGYQVVKYNNSDFYGGSTVNMSPSYLVPGDFTFTITWTNLDGSDVIDMPLANSQTNAIGGTSYGDYWVNNNGTWSLLTNSVPANLVANFSGQVPEPSAFGLVAIGGALLFGIQRLRRKA